VLSGVRNLCLFLICMTVPRMWIPFSQRYFISICIPICCGLWRPTFLCFISFKTSLAFHSCVGGRGILLHIACKKEPKSSRGIFHSFRFRSFCTIFRSSLSTIRNSQQILDSSNTMGFHTWRIFHSTSSD
jgi:hypothetical protein